MLESGDLSEDLEVEGSGEKGDPTAPSAKVSRRPLEKISMIFDESFADFS